MRSGYASNPVRFRDLYENFKHFDHELCGTVDFTSFEKTMRRLNVGLPDGVLASMFEQLADGAGRLDYRCERNRFASVARRENTHPRTSLARAPPGTQPARSSSRWRRARHTQTRLDARTRLPLPSPPPHPALAGRSARRCST